MDKSTHFGALLREWRTKKRISQLELALLTDISSRHISFLETSRATPSKETVLRLGKALDLPMCIHNLLLLAAGYNPIYQGSDLDSPILSPVRQAIARILEKHEPYPALVLNKTYDILFANHSLQALCQWLGYTLLPKTNYFDFLFGDHELGAVIENREQLLLSMLHRLKQESFISQNIQLHELYTRITQKVSPLHDNITETDFNNTPVLNIKIAKNKICLSLFSVLSFFGTPYNMTLEELKIETMFPSDDMTKEFFEHYC